MKEATLKTLDKDGCELESETFCTIKEAKLAAKYLLTKSCWNLRFETEDGFEHVHQVALYVNGELHLSWTPKWVA